LQWVGLEWLHRLVHEPRRLLKRYLKHNPRFIWYFCIQWMKQGLRRDDAGRP
jgi:N-acetylglucosaminyldiphosphoundecaprenol N-acetyl-beta-D-mannosaminyltransferase